MPTYDYACAACGHTLEHFQSMTAAPLKTCPACKKKSLKRLIGTGAGVIFKGAGFYTTDYRSESYKKAAESDKPAPAGDAVKDSTAGAAAPAPATPATPVAAEKPAPAAPAPTTARTSSRKKPR